MEDNYTKAYKEVIEILKYMPEESVNKIPETLLKTFETKQDKSHNFVVDENKNFEDQNLLEETKAIFANIFRDYWATPEQRERIIAKENYDRKMLEEEKRKKYNPDEIFKNKKKIEIPKNIKEDVQKSEKEEYIKETDEEISNLPVEIKKEKFYQRFINFIKRMFKI